MMSMKEQVIVLAIAHKIVHQKGGQIWAESEIGKFNILLHNTPSKT